MKYFYGDYKNKLNYFNGRIVIYKNYIMYSYIKTINHDYLIKALLSKYKLDNDTYNNVIRLYFINEDNKIIVSPARKIDDENFNKNYKYNGSLIKKEIK